MGTAHSAVFAAKMMVLLNEQLPMPASVSLAFR
jgi:hypothetical protein